VSLTWVRPAGSACAAPRGGDTYWGCDFHPEPGVPLEHYISIDLNEESLAARLPGERFDVIFCGEVIEHLFSPDALLQDLRALLAPRGIVILSTPNLGYSVNRGLLLLGISPLFLENSAETKLGRVTRRLGQGNSTEGHIRVFMYRALRELVALKGFVSCESSQPLYGRSHLTASSAEFRASQRTTCSFSHALRPRNTRHHGSHQGGVRWLAEAVAARDLGPHPVPERGGGRRRRRRRGVGRASTAPAARARRS
jgi:SAM-dependent methyltransferase